MIDVDYILSGKELDPNKGIPVWDESTLLSLDFDKNSGFNLPEKDFANEAFDTDWGVDAKQIFLLFSTPRSGSTAVCDYLYKTTNLVVHEYFQPYQYMPFIASRWGSKHRGYLDPKHYVYSLLKYRVGENGTLGVNLHGSHINVFNYFEKYYFEASLPRFALILKRRNKISQAVSYYVASRTKKWSSHFSGDMEIPEYSFSGIKSKLVSILTQELLIERYLADRPIPHQTIFYENISSSYGELIDDELQKKIGVQEININVAEIKKQAGELNKLYSEKFKKDLE